MEFSVIIPVYINDKYEWFVEAIESVTINQSLEPDFLIICKDGPVSEDIDNYISDLSLSDTEVRIISNENNIGLARTLARAVKECPTEIIARMDSDDISLSDRFEKQLKLMENFDIVGGDELEFENDITKIDTVRKGSKGFLLNYLYWMRCPLNHPTVMFRRKVVLSVGNYENMPLFEDHYLWLKLFKAKARINNLDEPLLYFRTNQAQLRRRHGVSYLRKELNFIYSSWKGGLLPISFVFLKIVLACVIRIIPFTVFTSITKAFFRKKSYDRN